jgi:hypothetical protein
MDRGEEHALKEVDRIAAAVAHLRALLLAARRAELRANGPPPTVGDRSPN